MPWSPLPCQELASESTFPSLSLSSTAESLEAAGAAVQRWLMPLSRPPFTFKYRIAPQPQETRAEGNTEDPCGSVCWSLVCAKFANNSPHEDYGGFFFVFFLRGLVLRFSWGNQPLSPHPGRCPLRFAGFSGILHGVRRYSLPVCWICSNVPGRTAEIVFFAQRGMLCMAGGQTKQMARYGRAMSRHERGRRDLTKRILASIKKRTRGNTTQKPSKICFCSGGLHFFPPFLRLAFTRLCPDRRLGFEKECPDLWGPL